MSVKVVRHINAGGFGVVEEIEDTVTGDHFARKTFKPGPMMAHDASACASARRRFVREVGIQAGLTHPNIVPIVTSDLSSDPPSFVMPLADEDYGEQIKRDRAIGKIDLDPLLHILAGLEELHRLGFVHRDMKPGNVLRLKDRWAISDLGLVMPNQRDTTTLTGTNSAYGTMAYAAPETITRFRDAPPQSDIFAFGCILHDLAVGTPRVPFQKQTATGPIGAIIERCTEPDPDDRFRNISALRNALVTTLALPSIHSSEPQVNEWATKLQDETLPLSKDDWDTLARYVEQHERTPDATLLLRHIDVPQLEDCFGKSPRAFDRLATSITEWVRDAGFDFSYCDVLASRLEAIYRLGDVRKKAQATMAALEMGCSHNRWFVMHLFMRMAGRDIDNDLADRLAIEVIALNGTAAYRMEQIENQIRVSRASLHPKVAKVFVDAEARRQAENARLVEGWSV